MSEMPLLQFVSTQSIETIGGITSLVKELSRSDNGETNENFSLKHFNNHEARRKSLSCQGKLKVLIAMTKRCKTVEL